MHYLTSSNGFGQGKSNNTRIKRSAINNYNDLAGGLIFSLIVELFNTGIEASVDHTSTQQHPLAKIVKDMVSAAQFLSLMLLFILWVMAL